MLLAGLAAACTIPRAAHATDWDSKPTGGVVLSLDELDRVTAGAVLARIDADAVAHGMEAFARASVTLHSLQGTALVVRPNAGTSTPMGTRAIDMTYGSGNAVASGDQGADCSVTATFLSTELAAAMVSATKQLTMTAAICQCSLWAVSLVK